MSFTTTNLANNQVLVEGTDIRGVDGQTVLDGSGWFALQEKDRIDNVLSTFDTTVEEFFRPLVEAAKQVADARKVTIDPLFYVVEQEAVQPTEGKAEKLVQLDDDTVILRAIAEGKDDRLIWVNDRLVVTTA